MGCSRAMDLDQFWSVIETARAQAGSPADTAVVAAQALAGLSALPAEEVLAAEQCLWELRARSYLTPLWVAARIISPCSDDGFEDFRGWLILQGRSVFEAALADPDSLAGVAAVQAAGGEEAGLGCEEALHITPEA